MRTIGYCVGCRKLREIAAHRLCFKCYRSHQRASCRQSSGDPRRTQGVRREHRRLLRGFTSLMVGLSDVGVSEDDVLVIRRILKPYLAPIADLLSPKDDDDYDVVNSEPQILDIVHRSRQPEPI
jgi:hypothetical protein